MTQSPAASAVSGAPATPPPVLHRLPWPIVATLGAFAVGMELCVIYLYRSSSGERGIAEMIEFFSGIGALIWPLVSAVLIWKVAREARVP